MHWTRVRLYCLIAAIFVAAKPVSGQDPAAEGVVQLDQYSGSMVSSGTNGSWIQVDTMAGDGVGFYDSYTRLGFRLKFAEFGDSHFFTEVNGTISNQANLGTNLNLGYRTLVGDGGMLGAFVGYDNYESSRNNSYQQAVVGGEYLGKILDLRANGYMPFGERENFLGVVDPGTETVFFGHDFGTIGTGMQERSLAGFDAEAGLPVPVADFLRMYVGPYFLTANSHDTWGVRSRLEARVGEGTTLNFMVTDDERFGTNLNFNATIWYGGGASPFKFMRDQSGAARRYDPIRRSQVVQVARDIVTVNVPLINTETGNRFNVTWVDNTATAPGNGTVETPFTSLPGSAPGSDYILVRRGVGDTVGNIVLEDRQYMYGEGRTYQVHTDRLGTIDIPDSYFDQTGARPNLVASNMGLPLVTLANNNSVINFNMEAGTQGIYGNTVNNFRLEHLSIDAINGIRIDNASGNGLLNNIDVLASGGGTGIGIRNNTAGTPLNLLATDITSTGGDSGFRLFADGATINGDVQNLTVDQTSGRAIVLDALNGTLNVGLENTSILNTGGTTNDGLEVNATNSVVTISLDDFHARALDDLIKVNGTNSDIQLTGQNVNVSNSVTGSGVEIALTNSEGVFVFENLTSSNNGDDGLRLVANTGSLVDLRIESSTLNENTDNAFDITSLGGSDVLFTVLGASATDSGAEAFQFQALGTGSVLTSSLTNVNLARAGESAISGTVNTGALSELTLNNVTASDSGLNGLNVVVADNSVFDALIGNSTFARSGLGNNGIGVNLSVTNNSDATLTMTNTPANNNGASGFVYDVNSGSTLLANVTNGNFSDNPDNNVFGTTAGVGSETTLNFNNVTADLLAANGGVVLSSTLGGVTNVLWQGATSSISQTTNDGVVLTADGAGSEMNFAFRDGRINSNGGRGIDVLASNSGSAVVNLLNATVTLNGEENVKAVAVTGGSAIVNATTSNLSQGGLGTGLDNVYLTADGAGSVVGGTFNGSTLNNSGRHGLNAEITNNGSLALNLTSGVVPGSISNNAAGHGLRISGVNADEIVVLGSGQTNISNNQLDNVLVDINGANTALIQLAGSMNGSVTGDGVRVDLTDVAAGGISISGLTVNNNFDDGIQIDVANSTLDAGISVTGMTLTGNGGEPILVTTTGSTVTGGSITGNTTSGGTNGISWFTDSGTVDVNIGGNIVNNATTQGILVELSGTAVGNDVDVSGNIVNAVAGVPATGIKLSLADTASLTSGRLNNNISSNKATHGLLVDVSGTSEVVYLEVINNQLNNNGSDGFKYQTAGTTTLGTLVVSENIANQNGGNGLNVNLQNVSGPANIELSDNQTSNNTQNGVVLTGVDSKLGTVLVNDNTSSTNGGDGLRIDLTSPGGTGTLAAIQGTGNTVTNNTGTGLNVILDNLDTTTTIPQVILDDVTATGNGAGGVNISVTDMDTTALAVINSVVSGNTGSGIAFNLDSASSLVVTAAGSSSNANTGHGVLASLTNSNIQQLQVFENNALTETGAGLSGNTLDGIHLRLANNSELDVLFIDDNLINGNGSDGIDVEIRTGSRLSETGVSVVSNNVITNHAAGDGFRLVNPETAGTDMNINFTQNTITGNTGGQGVNLTLNNQAGTLTTEFIGNTISQNGQNGVLLSTTGNSGIDVIDFSRNTVSSNGNMGVRIDAEQNSNINFAGGVTGSTTQRNVLTGNRNAGIGAVYSDNSTGNFELSNTTITNTLAGADANFNGSGVRIVTQDNARVGTFVVGGSAATPGASNVTITGNAGSGISLVTGQLSGIYNSTTLAGPEIRNAVITGNSVDGINFTRLANSKVDNIQIENNNLSSNNRHGIMFDMQGGNVDIDAPLPNSSLVIDALIRDNLINNSVTGSAIHHQLDSDVHMNTVITGNELSNNNLDGITLRTNFDSILNGNWSDNVITGNRRDGISILMTERSEVGTGSGLLISESQISNNTRDGIRIETTGSVAPTIGPDAIVQIMDNGPAFAGDPRGIMNNGANGINLISNALSTQSVSIEGNRIDRNTLDGLNVNSSGNSVMVVSATENTMSENRRHGVNLLNSNFAVQSVLMTDNQVVRNTQRGVTLLNQGQQADAILTITGTVDPRASSGTAATSLISQNGQIGLYIENNAGVLESTNDIELTLRNTAIVGNGTNTAVTDDNRNGVYIRVGTSGGFVGSTGGGHVNATVQQNFMSGNGNVDFVTDSFVATPDPGVSSQYTTAGYRFDPLARLGLVLENNTGDTIDVVRNGAFYVNADAFKSPGALFDSTARRRNAQRFTDSWIVSATSVSGSTAPAAGAIATTAGPGVTPNNSFVNLGIQIPGTGAVGGANRDITGYAAGTNVSTFTPALGAAPAVGTLVDIEAINISGLGSSTFRTNHASIGAGGNVFGTIITNFGTNFGLNPGDPDAGVIMGHTQTFTWDTIALPFY